MKKTFASICVAVLWLFTALPSQAITISFNPTAQNTNAGSSVDVALLISGLTGGTAPSLSTFDLDISFNPGLLSFASVAFGDPILGDQLDILGLGGNPTFSGITSPGVLNLFELSLDSATDLNNLQAGSFTLATLTFNTLDVGTSALDLTINSLGDANGAPLIADVSNGSITVVPEPNIIMLFCIGLLGFVFAQPKRLNEVRRNL